MKLRPVQINEYSYLQPNEWRFKKSKIKGKIHYNRETNAYFYVLFHPSFKNGEYHSVKEGKEEFQSKEKAAEDAEAFIDMWDLVQGRINGLI